MHSELTTFAGFQKRFPAAYETLKEEAGVFGQPEWLKFLSRHGQTPYCLLSLSPSKDLNFFLPLVKVSAGPFPVWFFYEGPYLSHLGDLEKFLQQLPVILRRHRIGFLKGLSYNRVFEKAVTSSRIGWEESRSILLDLAPNTEELFEQMEGRARTSIRKAEKARVSVEKADPGEIEEKLKLVYPIYSKTYDTAEKENPTVNRKSLVYLSDLFKQLGSAAQLYVSHYEGQAAAFAVILKSRKSAFYYAGASDIELNRLSAASTLLQWEIIKDLKKEGLKIYDLGGIPPHAKESGPAFGVYQFKIQFGGAIRHFYSPFFRANSLAGHLSACMVNCALPLRNTLRSWMSK